MRHSEKKVSKSWVRSRLIFVIFPAKPRSECQRAELIPGLGVRGVSGLGGAWPVGRVAARLQMGTVLSRDAGTPASTCGP